MLLEMGPVLPALLLQLCPGAAGWGWQTEHPRQCALCPSLSAHCSSLKECLQRCRAVWSIYPAVSALNGPVQTSPLDLFCVLMVFVGAEVCLSAVSRSSSTVTGSAMVGLWEPQRRQLWQVAKQRNPNLTCISVNTQTEDTEIFLSLAFIFQYFICFVPF